MCGIYGYVGTKKNAAEIVLKGLKQLEYRGYDSWGVATRSGTKKQLVVEKQIGKIGSSRLQNHVASDCAIGHTRWATHGGVTVANAHPHLDASKRIALVHNGIIENYQELREQLITKGYTFVSETDSEVGVQLIAEYLKTSSFIEAVQRAFLAVRVLNAWVVLDQESRQLVAVRNGSPLAVGRDQTGYYLASDTSALSEYTDQVYFFEDGELLCCDGQTATLYDATTLTEKPIVWQKLDITAQDLSLGTHQHFMIKEIIEQPKVLQNILATSLPLVRAYAKQLHQELAFVGCGSAYHAALMSSYFLSLIAKKRSAAYIGSEFTHVLPLFESDGFVTFLSQSGETIDLLENVTILKKKNRAFGAIVNRLGSTLERSTENKILLGAGPEQCVLATKSWTAKVAVLFLLAHELAGTLTEATAQLATTIKTASGILTPSYRSQHIVPLAQKLSKAKNFFILGRGVSYPAALEAALKIKEVTYIHTEGFAGGELKHGVIALIEKGTPCLLFAPNDATYASMISTAMEIKSRGAFTIGITDVANEAFDYVVPIRYTGLSSVITQSIVAQLLAYELALILGRDPDKPRNLAKSVTVK